MCGKSDFKSAKSIFNKSLFSGFTIFTIPVILMTFMPSYFILCQTDNNNVIAQGSPFLVWSSFVQLLTFFVILCESNMRLTGDGFTPLVIGTITILLNIFFNFCFIGGHFGFSPMEVKGAAVATTLARVIQFVILIGFFVLKGLGIYKSISNPLPSTVISRLKN
uniref:MATE family efflux transporter n=1 Tax=Succinivibrio sp. TaxID=2053619 RepID=UPI00402AE53F